MLLVDYAKVSLVLTSHQINLKKNVLLTPSLSLSLSLPPPLFLFCLARSPVDDRNGQKRPSDGTVAPERKHLGEARREPRPGRRLRGHAPQRQGHVERPGRPPRDDPAASVGPCRAAAAAVITAGAVVVDRGVQRGGRGPPGDGGVEAGAVDAADGHLASLERRGVVARLVSAKLYVCFF